MQSASDLLMNDHGGNGLKTLREELFVMGQELKKNMDKGLSADEMKVALAYKEALDLTEACLDDVHTRINK